MVKHQLSLKGRAIKAKRDLVGPLMGQCQECCLQHSYMVVLPNSHVGDALPHEELPVLEVWGHIHGQQQQPAIGGMSWGSTTAMLEGAGLVWGAGAGWQVHGVAALRPAAPAPSGAV